MDSTHSCLHEMLQSFSFSIKSSANDPKVITTFFVPVEKYRSFLKHLFMQSLRAGLHWVFRDRNISGSFFFHLNSTKIERSIFVISLMLLRRHCISFHVFLKSNKHRYLIRNIAMISSNIMKQTKSGASFCTSVLLSR